MDPGGAVATGGRTLELLRGTLDLLILKTLSHGSLHGYGISLAIRRATGDTLQVDEGALYPALRRLEKRGVVEAEWKASDTGREAKFYELTPAGTRELESELGKWTRYVEAMSQVLDEPVRS
jgi:transcriptional regulator